jgi:hypothetical protein
MIKLLIKAFSAIAVAGLLATTLTILPGLAPEVAASVPQPLAKGDRLDIRPIGAACSEQACLRTAGTKTAVRAARPVAVDRVR